MLGTKYLYNIEPEELDDKLYYEALSHKLHHAKELCNELYYNPRKTYLEQVQLFMVRKAIKHTIGLIEEKEERE